MKLLAVFVAAFVIPGAAVETSAQHDKAYWRAIAAGKFAVPAGASVPALVNELSGFLGSSDPELRDDIAYSTLTSWIYRQKIVPVETRRALLDEWIGNLGKGVGERGTDTVFRRSFSALALGVLAITDNETPFLEKADFDRVLSVGLAYLAAERDTRGFDATKGWIHSVAHTADLLKFLARSRHMQPAQQAQILRAINDKLTAVDGVLTHGEDERLARTVLSIAARPDCDIDGFRTWAASLSPVRSTAAPTPASLAVAQNRKNLVVSLFAVLSTDARDLPGIQAARTAILATLKTLM